MTVRIHLHVADANDGFASRTGCRYAPAQERFDANDHLHDAERFGQIVVSAGAKAPHLVDLLSTRAQDQNGHGGVRLPKLIENLVAAHAREHQVEDDELRIAGSCLGQPLLAGMRDDDFVALYLEVGADSEREIAFILDDEDTGHASIDCGSAVLAPWSGALACAAGSRTVKTAPSPDVPLTEMVPPSALTSSRTTASPRSEEHT